RPPNNREPTEEEVKACTPYLDRQIEIIKPKIIVTLGNVATTYIFKKFGLKVESISRIHGKVFEVSTLLGKIKIIPMYHPATALYNPRMKDVLREDWKKLRGLL
ncbi:MAG TPA: uracil-DNA glycosylase, partial [Candidatus Aenigmarchaeota archaeon]|nr:uracil-DNA glycosylase [Candidatus Aenigmarchaeota archaeon]